MSQITIISQHIHSDLPVRDIALTFRDHIKRPAKALARFGAWRAGLSWEFITPEEDNGPFAQFESSTEDEPTYTVLARYRSRSRSLAGAGIDGDILLKIWDSGTYREAQISTASGAMFTGIQSVLAELRRVDPEMKRTETKNRIRL